MTQARQQYKATHAAFSGGEPTLHPQFAEIVDAAVDLGLTWHMVSNGSRFATVLRTLQARAERIRGLTAITFSLDGATEQVHDSIRGEGSYRDVMTAVTLCTAASIKFALQIALHAKNIHEIEAYAIQAAQLGAAKISFSQTQPTGTHHDQNLFLTAKQWNNVRDRIERLQSILSVPIIMPEGFESELPFHICAAFTQSQLHVDVEGRLNLCCMHSDIPAANPDEAGDLAGDLATMSLTKAHANLVGIIHRAQVNRIEAIESGQLSEWDKFPCNYCLKSFGKPHWTADGAAGPSAQRPRWQGAWAERNRRLPIVR